MTFKPMFALHKDRRGDVLAAADFKANYNLGGWLRELEVRPGDTIEFHEAAQRAEFDEVEEPPLQAPLQPPAPSADEPI